MDKITLDFTGLTREQISEIQSFVDTKLVAFRKEQAKVEAAQALADKEI